MTKLNENTQLIGDQARTDGGIAVALIEYARDHANTRDWPVFGVTERDRHLIPFRLSPNIGFKWEANDGQMTLLGGEAGLTFGELIDTLESIYGEFDEKREQANAEAGLEKEMFIQHLHIECKLTSTQSVGNEKLANLKPLVCDGLQAVFLVPAKMPGALRRVPVVEELLRKMDRDSGGKLSYPLILAIVNFIINGIKATTINGTTAGISDNANRDQFFLNTSVDEGVVKANCNNLAFAVNTLPLDKRREISQYLRAELGGNFTGKIFEFDFIGSTQSAINAQIVEYNSNARVTSNVMFAAGKQTLQEFQQWWASVSVDLKNSFCSNINTIYYAKFPGDTTSDAANSDSTVRRTEFIAYISHPEHGFWGDLYVYGKTPPPHKRTPTYETIMVIKVKNKLSAFNPFLAYDNGKWHGHLYKLLTNAVNSSPFGLRVVYDPQGYLNWLYANLPGDKRTQLKDVGPGVPQTIGLNVTIDLTEGIPRRQQAPLSKEQLAAMEAALKKQAEDGAAAAAAEANAAQNLLNAQQVKAELESVLPPILKTKQFTGLIDFWPGTANAGYSPPRHLPNVAMPYVVIRFPGSSKNEYVGKDAKQMLDDLGLWEYVQPIADKIIQKFGEDLNKQPELILAFDNTIDLKSFNA